MRAGQQPQPPEIAEVELHNVKEEEASQGEGDSPLPVDDLDQQTMKEALDQVPRLAKFKFHHIYTFIKFKRMHLYAHVPLYNIWARICSCHSWKH